MDTLRSQKSFFSEIGMVGIAKSCAVKPALTFEIYFLQSILPMCHVTNRNSLYTEQSDKYNQQSINLKKKLYGEIKCAVKYEIS